MWGWISELKSGIARIAGANPFAGLCVFGKHPGWNDHLDDIGVVSDALIAAKQILYVQGIGGVIDSGQWDVEANDILPAFRHVFLWADSRSIIVGRMWSSSDGKGRTKYPMIACIHLEGRTAAGIPDVLPLLESLETQCRAATTADEVRAILTRENARCNEFLASPEMPPIARSEYMTQLGIAPNSDQALRIAYSLQNHLAPLAQSPLTKAAIHLRLAESCVPPQHVRFPAVASKPIAAFQFWREFLAGILPPAVPQLYITPLDSPWVDVVVGLPSAKVLSCIRSGAKQTPLASEIPYTIDGSQRSSAEAVWRSFVA